MRVVLFEDNGWEKLQPLSLTRPLWELRCGVNTIEEKIRRIFPDAEYGYICRDYLIPLVQEQNGSDYFNDFATTDTLFVNSRFLWNDPEIFKEIIANTIFYCGDKVAAGFVKGKLSVESKEWGSGNTTKALFDLLTFKERMCGLFRRDVTVKEIEYPWDIVEYCPEQIAEDVRAEKGLWRVQRKEYRNQGVYIVPGGEVWTDGKIDVMPGVVLDSSNGPIYIGDGSKIMPNAVIQGPASIGKGSLVKIGAKIYQGTSAGPVCKLGGEIEETVIIGYSNKQHEGFLGHAVIGEWCNLGAGTENSDLKNNYSQVKVQIGDIRVNSGKLFAGLYMGDHSKTGINTTFNTGTTVGVGAMAYGAGFQPRFIPSFHWSDGNKLISTDFNKTVETARVVKSRRKLGLSDGEIAILKYVYENFSGQVKTSNE